MIWLLLTVLAATVSVLLMLPLLKPSIEPEDRRQTDLVVLRGQLAQVDDDQAQGLLSEAEAETTRLEIQRRILRTISQAEKMDAARKTGKPATKMAALTAIAVLVSSLGLYWRLGSPVLPQGVDRNTTTAKQDAAKSTQTEATRRALSLVDQLKKRLAVEPNKREDWLLLGRTFATIARHAAAAEALGRALELDSNDAEVTAELGEALVLAVGGRVTGPARAAFLQARKLDNKQAAARFFLALNDYQNNRPQSAYNGWLDLIRDLPADAPGYGATLSQLQRVAKQLGIDLNKELPAPKPSVAADKDPGKSKFILEMVNRLAGKLKSNPDNLPGWLRLGRSYMVLKQYKKAAEAYGEAAKRRPKNADIQAQLGRALVQATAPGQPLSQDAITAFKTVLKLDNNHPDALWFLGWDAVLKGDRTSASAFWRRLLKITKPGSEQHKNLSAALAELKKQN